MTALMVVLAYALYNLVFTLFSYPVGKLSDKVGRWPTLMIGWILYAVVYFGFGLANAFRSGSFLRCTAFRLGR